MSHREHVCVLCVVQNCLKRTPNALQASRTSHVPAGASVRVVYGTFHKVMRWGELGGEASTYRETYTATLFLKAIGTLHGCKYPRRACPET